MNKQSFFFLISCFCLFIVLSCKKQKVDTSQGFVKYFGGIDIDAASDVQQTSDGGYIIIGTTKSYGHGGNDMYVVKTDASGNEQWHKTFGDSLDDAGASVQQTTDGGYVFLGTYRYTSGPDSNTTDAFLVKTNSNGDTVFTKKYGYSIPADPYPNEVGESIKQTADGGYIIAGNTDAQNGGDMIVCKTDASGILQQPIAVHPSAPSPGFDGAINILPRQDGSSGYILSSYSASLNSPREIFINNYPVSTSSNAPVNADFAEPTMEMAGEVALTYDGEYITTGQTTTNDIFILKFNNAISTPKIWYNTYGGPGIDVGSSIQATPDGGYVILGTTTSYGAGNKDIYLFKTDGTGNVSWSQTFGGGGVDVGAVVRNTSDGGFVAIGVVEFGSDPSNSGKDNIICLIKTNAKGEIGN